MPNLIHAFIQYDDNVKFGDCDLFAILKFSDV